ncbi:MAG: hypothetical protein DWI22_13910 [Planctomycetota bacterium]|nr:MAG: hypothetical protein DWI22_13910 [Planctomycetota bacterium]
MLLNQQQLNQQQLNQQQLNQQQLNQQQLNQQPSLLRKTQNQRLQLHRTSVVVSECHGGRRGAASLSNAGPLSVLDDRGWGANAELDCG